MACCVCSLKSTWEGWEQWYMYTFSPSTTTLGVKGLCGLGCQGTHFVDQSSLKPTETYCLYLLMPLGIKACVTTWQLGSKAFRQYKRKCDWCQWGKQASVEVGLPAMEHYEQTEEHIHRPELPYTGKSEPTQGKRRYLWCVSVWAWGVSMLAITWRSWEELQSSWLRMSEPKKETHNDNGSQCHETAWEGVHGVGKQWTSMLSLGVWSG